MEIPDFNSFLALAFGAWAGVVGYIGRGIRQDLQTIAADLKEESKKLNQYIVSTETRLARIEEQIEREH
jgi:hypothetical protein